MSLSGDAPPFELDVASGREFSKARRGYDPTEVRAHLAKLTEEIRRLRAAEAELRSQLERATAAPGDPAVLDPAAISRALGDETVRIIDTAREASDEIRAKAEENAARVVRDAHDRANRLTRDAAELRETAARETDELIAATQAQADATLADAHSEADSILDSATQEAAAAREAAALVLEERTAEAQLEAARIGAEAEATRAAADVYAEQRRSDAELAASAAAERAEADAEEVLEAARERGREMIREAKEARERMIRDLAERRHASRQQLEALRAGRERLIEAFGTAQAALDDATNELVDSLPAARVAADAAARAVDHDLDAAVAELDALIEQGADSDELIDGPTEPTHVVAAPDPDPDPGPAALASDDDATALDEALGESAEPANVVPFDTTADPDVLADESGDLDGDLDDADIVDIDAVEAEADADAADDDDVGQPSDLHQIGRLRLVSSNDGQPVPIGLEALVDDAVEPSEESSAESAGVEEIFARLRANRSAADLDDDDLDDDDDDDDDDDLDDDDDDEDRPVAAVTEISPGAVVIDLSTVGANADDAVDDADARDARDALDDDQDTLDDEAAAAQQAMLDQRDALLGDLSHSLSRRVRRVVTDQENEVLDLVRRNRRLTTADDLVPLRADQLDAYRAAIHTDLREVLAAGADFVAADPRLDDDAVESALDELLAAVGDWGVDPLRMKLARIVDDNDDTSPDRSELVDRLRSTYREWRNDRIGEFSGDLVTLAFSKGVMIASRPDQQLCWMVDHGGLPCPDGEDNQLAGPVTVGQEFPTGDVCPPAHPGCRCLLVPATH